MSPNQYEPGAQARAILFFGLGKEE